METEQRAHEVADKIMEVASECRKNGINDIFINSIVYRGRNAYRQKINEVNNIVAQKCSENGYIFISNDFINEDFLGDGLHFSRNGVVAYMSNLASFVNYHYENV